jgi:hypothetical protein
MRWRLPVSVGQLVVVAGVTLFFMALRLDGWYWRDFGVPAGPASTFSTCVSSRRRGSASGPGSTSCR